MVDEVLSLRDHRGLRRRLPELDAVRGIAALAVLEYHLLTWSSHTPGRLASVLRVAFRPGWLGVDLFFVLSGFLITGILIDTADQTTYFAEFYLRRAFRILPVYYGSAILTLLIARVLGTSIHWPGVILAGVFLANIPIESTFGFGGYWSLAVEEHFYLLWPWVVRTCSKRSLLAVACGILLLEPALRYASGNGALTYSLTPFRLDGLAWGAALAIAWRDSRYTPVRAARAALLLLALCLISGVIMLQTHSASRVSRLGTAFQFSVINAGFAGSLTLLLVIFRNSPSRIGMLRPLGFVGDISYFVYLNHLIVIQAWDRTFPGIADRSVSGLLARALVVNAVVLALGVLSRRYMELPLVRIRDRVLSVLPGSVRARNRAP